MPLDSALTGGTPFEFEYTPAVVFTAFLTCAIAIAVNFSTFLVIGKCDAVTYQVLGHLKTMLARPISRRSPYDRVGAVNVDP